MNQDFKRNILDYLVGNYRYTTPLVVEGTPKNSPRIKQVNTPVNIDNLVSYVSENNLNNIKTITSNDKIILYGRKGNTNNGFILLLDNSFNVIQLFETYEGGTALPGIEYLKQIEDGTFIALARTYNNSPNTFNFLQLNNFTLTIGDTYKVRYRQQYALPNAMQTQLNQNTLKFEITKKQGEATYLFTYLFATDVEHSFYEISMNSLKIVVGAENEWQNFITDDYKIPTAYDLYAEWYQNDFRVKFAYDEGISEGLYEYKYINGTVSESNFYIYKYLQVSTFTTTSVAIKNFESTFASTWKSVGQDLSFVRVYCFNKQWYDSHNNDCSIFFAMSGQGSYTNQLLAYDSEISLYVSNNIVFGYEQYNGTYKIYYFTDDNTGLPNKNGGGATMGTSFYYNIGNETIEFLNVNNVFNLYNAYLIPTDWQNASSAFVYNFNFIYNVNNYNGLSYNSLESLIPNSGILYDENDKIIFARNLYNKTINQNTTESTIEIPNIYLNDNTISKQELYNKTNSVINTNESTITKNIYETLYINFFNTLNMKNANDPNNIIINLPGASRLNGSISGYNSYDNVKIGNVRIVYNDNTYLDMEGFKIQNNWNPYTISFSLYVGKSIKEIKIMSSDKMTTYQTITPTLEVGKTYNISQNVKIV